MQLQVHLEGEQYIVFDDDADRDVLRYCRNVRPTWVRFS